ncbi:MAG TPA: glycosyltransferase [Solirubrobacterales bacterium]
MPAWRPREGWLEQAVRSALAQTGCAIELLLIDDGSPVPVADLLQGLDDPRLRVIRIGHGGVAHARNAGIAEARGDYLRFIDADDAIAPASTSLLLGLCEGRGDLVAYGATLFCDEDLQPLWKMTSEVEGDGVAACLMGRFQTRITAFLFPRRVIELTGAFDQDFEVSADWDFILRALEHAQVRGTGSVASLYRRHPGGTTANPAAGAKAAERVAARYFERHPEQRGTALERKARARTLAHAGRIYATHRQPGKAISRLVRAMRLDPGAAWIEVSQGLPRLAARARRVLRREPQNVREPPPRGS